MLKKAVIFLHRWLGVALCLLFLIWFPSGIGMMYWDFPGVTSEDRLERSIPLDSSTIHLSPAEALASIGQLPPPSQARLNTFDGRPVYRFRVGRGEVLVYAGLERSRNMRRRLHRTRGGVWVRAVASATVETRTTPTSGPSRSLARAAGVFMVNGSRWRLAILREMHTTGLRLGAYLGPIPHWIYFTPLRRHQAAWNAFVTWSSGIGTFAAGLGIVVGVWMFSPSKRYRFGAVPSHVPYRGQKRWHMVLGLIFGLGAMTWAFSGMLSMDPFPAMSERPRSDIPRALRGQLRLAAFEAKNPREVMAQLKGQTVKELEMVIVGDEPVYLASVGQARTRIVPTTGPPREEFDRERIVTIVKEAAQPDGLAEARVVDRYDAYYLDRRLERPLPVILARVNDADHTRYYIDPKTARVVGSYSARTWMSRWLYHGLHSLDFPWLYDYRPLWDVVVIAFMLGGTALGVTSLILAWRVIGSYLPSR
jgi:hypothetical protein